MGHFDQPFLLEAWDGLSPKILQFAASLWNRRNPPTLEIASPFFRKCRGSLLELFESHLLQSTPAENGQRALLRNVRRFYERPLS